MASDYSLGRIDMADIRRDARQTVAGFDTLGLERPRGWRYTQLAYYKDYSRALAEVGIEYACGGRSMSILRPGGVVGTVGFNYNFEVRRAHGGPSTIKKGNWVSAYPNILPQRYHITSVSGDSQTITEFRRGVMDAVELKGSWHIFAGHNWRTWNTHGSSGSADMYEAMALIDSLEAVGLLRVVTMTEGYDLFYNTPINSTANFIYPNFTDVRDGDGALPLMLRYHDNLDFGMGENRGGGYSGGTLDSLGTRDSTYIFPNVTHGNHGMNGMGYATLGWLGSEHKTFFDVASSSRRQFQFEAVWSLPNFAPGQTVEFEGYAQVDMDVMRAGGVPAVPGNADTMDVYFYTDRDYLGNAVDYSGSGASRTKKIMIELQDYTDRAGAPNPAYGRTSAHTNDANKPTNYTVFAASDTVGGTWLHFNGTWKVPADGDYLYVSLCKDSRLVDGAVRISNVSLCLIPRYGSLHSVR
ncbi:MAG: hypothetical protein JRC86_08380 [Deltaproteobacteria bacterium]|nr:hypothetical protein [Deltaproteobacteria bacterium]